MENKSSSLGQRLKQNEDGVLYVLIGLITALLSWFLIPIVGLVSVYCGYKLYQEEEKLVLGGLIALVGFIGVALWIGWLLSAEI